MLQKNLGWKIENETLLNLKVCKTTYFVVFDRSHTTLQLYYHLDTNCFCFFSGLELQVVTSFCNIPTLWWYLQQISSSKAFKYQSHHLYNVCMAKIWGILIEQASSSFLSFLSQVARKKMIKKGCIKSNSILGWANQEVLLQNINFFFLWKK